MIPDDRAKKLIMRIGQKYDFSRGWRRAAAQELGISPAYLSSILAGRRKVGMFLLERFEAREGADDEFVMAAQRGALP